MTYRPNQWPVPVPRRERGLVDLIHWAVFFGAVLLVALIASACAPKAEVRTEYVTVTKDVDRIVQVRCEDKRQPLADLPDDDDELAAISLDDPLAIFRLAQRYVAARLIYRQRLNEDDAQIKACTGG